MAAEVDVYGIDETLKKFDLHRCEDFAVFTGQGDKWRLKFPGSGRELFEENVRSIDPNNDATYQVRFYKRDFDEDSITNNTPYSSSYNFKVRPKQVGMQQGGGNNSGNWLSAGDQRYMAFLERELEKYKEKCEDLESDLIDANERLEGYEDKGKKKLGAIGQLGEAMNEYPQLSNLLQPMIHAFTNFFNKGNAAPGIGIVDPGPAKSEEEIELQFKTAMSKLMGYYQAKYGQQKGDQQLAQDMAKLANLTDKPFIFEAAIAQLRSM